MTLTPEEKHTDIILNYGRTQNECQLEEFVMARLPDLLLNVSHTYRESIINKFTRRIGSPDEKRESRELNRGRRSKSAENSHRI